MRYSLIAAFVGAAIAAPYVETVYDTKVYTITSCGPEVSDCPGKKTSTVAPVATTTCTDEVKKATTTPVVYVSTSSAAPPPPPPSTKKAEETTPCPTTTLVVKTSAPAKGPEETHPAPPPYTSAPAKGPETHPAPPPYQPAPTGGAAKPSVSASTGVVPYKTTSALATKTTSPAVYTGAASHVQVAGLVGAGAIAAFFL